MCLVHSVITTGTAWLGSLRDWLVSSQNGSVLPRSNMASPNNLPPTIRTKNKEVTM
jgi:hypothetical protein